ncbi:phosphopantetheine-binding protein, partial [Methylogaea oryzae]|uniref:phosphopantetheine-binding protein n=1 Tax=Methylogaea oryzae TaxID=1295382 RepID=UPI0020D1F01A
MRYCATDLSPYLAKSLQDRCAEEGWEIQAGALDIGRAADPAEHAAWDIVVAANVVHATGDIAASLSHLKARLAPAGRLVLNELTASRDLGTLVFGLTPQWWSAEDTDSRFPDGPAAAPAVWLDLLAESGFVQPLLVGVEGEAADSSQSLITAVADGWMPVARFSQGAGRGEGETKRSRPFDPLIPTFSQGEKELRVPGFVDSEAEDAEGGDQLAAMLDYLKGVFAAVLGVDPADMRPGDTFERYGVESLSAMEIRNRIAADHPWVGSTLLFEYNTLQRLAERLLEQGAQQGAAVAA